MELLDIYNNIKNPIDDPDIIHKLINIYGDYSTVALNFYDKVNNQHRQGKRIIDKNQYLEKSFEIGSFKKWRNEVLSMTQEQFEELYKQGIYGPDFVKLRTYLKQIPEIKTIDDINNIKYGHEVPKIIQEAFEKYSWDANEQPGCKHVSTGTIYAKKKEDMPIEHELYLNVDSTAIHMIVMEFVNKCDDLGIPFNIKMDTRCVKDNNLIVYSDTKHLPLTISILETIRIEHPEIETAFHEPPILSGKINAWLGYGTAPSDKKDYLINRVDIISEAISKTSKEWIKNNIIKMINFRDNYIHFYEYITVAMIESKLKELKSTYRYYDDCGKIDKRHSNPNYALSKLGLKLIDLESIEFKDYLYKSLIKNMEDRIISFCEDPNYKFKIEVPARDGHTISFNQYDLENTIGKISPKIVENDPDYESKVIDSITEECKNRGVDKSKFCFDTDMVYRFINENNDVVKKKIPIKIVETIKQSKPIKKIIEPIKIVSKRNTYVHTNYVPSKKILNELQELIDNDTDKVLTYMHENMHAVRILLPYLVEHHRRLADMFVDDVIIKYPEVQKIYENALKENEVKRGL